jgi:hypothetical protein
VGPGVMRPRRVTTRPFAGEGRMRVSVGPGASGERVAEVRARAR